MPPTHRSWLPAVTAALVLAALACNLPFAVQAPLPTAQPQPQNTSAVPGNAPSLTAAPVPSSTPHPPSTVAPTGTTAPTVAPSATPSPTSGSVELSAPEISTGTLYHGGACTPNQITFKVKASIPAQVKNVILFYRLQDKSTDSHTDWNEGVAMNPSPDGTYVKTIPSSGILVYGSFANAWLYYQFVATDKQGNFIRSRVYTNLTMLKCP